jgi:ribonuclease BN (tRNA processing enzyme)
LTTTQAAELASAAAVEQLWLMHMAPRYRGAYDQLVVEAQQRFTATYADLVTPEDPALEHA